jgi:glycosyltransferase involved in cell wall biosynthesis
MKPFVSILIPCYNAERWIAQTIESALAQTWIEKEILVMDDGSTDGSLEIVKRFGDRIRWETGPNRGGNAARNRLLALARGDWVQYLDADDYLVPEKISKQVSSLHECPETDILFSPFILEHWSEKGVRIETTIVPEPHDIWVLLARWFLPGTGSGIWRKQALIDVGGWNERQPCCQEHELYLRLLMAARRFTYCPHAGYVYRQWSEQTVCKRNKRETHRQRLEIEQRVEEFLHKHDELTPCRKWAINMARFEIARIAWQRDHDEALSIVRTIRSTHQEFIPAGNAAPPIYQMAFRMFGFRFAETIADWRRRLSYFPRSA